MTEMTNPRLRAICDLSVPVARASAGRHEYDGRPQDLSPAGVKQGLAALDVPLDPAVDPHDRAHLAAATEALRVEYDELELHRHHPMPHIANLDVSGYEAAYAPAEQRADARRRHLSQWPDLVDAAIEALDRVPAPVAEATIGLARGLGSSLTPQDDPKVRRALDRFVAHLENAAKQGPPNAALGDRGLTRLMSAAEAREVDLGRLVDRAAAERDRMRALLDDARQRLAPGATVAEAVRRVQAQHPDEDGVFASARALVSETLAWVEERKLVPYVDGSCEVRPTPESQRWAAAGMTGAAPYEPDFPARFDVTPPDPRWPADAREAWLASYFNRATLPVIVIHEVAPGHLCHSRARRRAGTDVRRTLGSSAFEEGWAHYCEELAWEEGFHAGDPHYAFGVALDALRRVARLTCAIGLHTGAMTLADAAATFAADAYVDGPGGLAEARRGLIQPNYGEYTWGKLAIRDLRVRARQRWGARFSLARFHTALLELGSAPLGLLETAIERG